jgi:hypothetical protein
MQPNPIAETSRLLFPSFRFCIVFPLIRNQRPRRSSLIVADRASGLTMESTIFFA